MTDCNKVISVFGYSKGAQGEQMFDSAYNIGKLLAENGFTVANGGYGGTMLASSKGASDAGGKVIGVTCSAFKGSPNEYVTEEIRTDCLQNRLQKLVDVADGYIVLPGGTGTLLELAHIWEFKNKNFLKGDKPIIMFSDFWEHLFKMMGSIDTKSTKCVQIAQTEQQVIELLLKG